MTVVNAKRSRPVRRPMLHSGVGLLVGAIAAFGAVHAAPQSTATPTSVAPMPSRDPAKQLPGTIAVSNIDFKRGDGGAGRLILRFDGDGAAPDLRSTGSTVTINVGNAKLPANLQKPINVSDFATPVQRIDARPAGEGAQLVLNTSGNYESMAYQTGREYIVEIVPRASTATASRGKGTGQAMGATTSGASTRAYSGRPVTFNFQDVPVRTVLQLIAEESGLNVVAADTVQGNVTLRLVNVPWDQALDLVLQAKGLDKRRSGNVVWVAPQSEIAKYEQDREDARIALDNRVDLVTEYIQINYHNAAQIFKALTEAKGVGGGGAGAGGSNQDSGFLSPRGRLVADERTNTLMVSDIPKKIAQMKELIRVIDRPVDQVVIEARVVIATETFSRELGAKFGISGASGTPGDRSSVGFGGSTDASSANAIDRGNNVSPTNPRGLGTITQGLMTNLPVTTPAGAVALSILNAGYLLDVELSAMQQEGRGEVISNPRVVTSNQREAIISQGQEVGYVTISPQQGGNDIPIPNVQFKDVLLQMKVTPTITNDGRVFLNMAVKKDEVEGFVDTSIGQVPQISKREVNTAVLVEDGQTVVIGGVYEFRDRSDITKVPFLGDVPFLGNLFKKKGRNREKAELLIFVTPKVLQVTQR
ncbi:type IV pilus secretin PilQ [Lysobacter niastensis]|uniref:Type IV pilus secretin PilQ family protein n=1 Tax=Lysobacter niastensis TaxID=380629 RepID=A0ABS0B1S2_9GAMM|nr:type IV pilus secretin PilQ family protein [Lysobacter niastensis]MBF6022437.1 type IV pilus secretin PilQ family protein [Lysobacter niastensis]